MLQQLIAVSPSLTPAEIKSLCCSLSKMYHTMGHLLVVKALDTNGVAHTGILPVSLLFVDSLFSVR